MKETIRVEEQEDEKVTSDWKNAIEKTRKRIKELEQEPPEPTQPEPGQPAP
jgi:predicted ribosome quality control (RQC) complex YloA/Tae2 family protein